MPIYEYKCQACGDVFEHLCFASDDDNNIDCPACGGKKTDKLLSAFCSVSSDTSQGLDSSAAASHSCASHRGFS